MSGVERELRDINAQLSSLHRPYENAIAALRNEVVEMGRALTDALPRRAIETLEGEVRSLSERIDRSRQAGAEGASLSAVEQELAEVRNALHRLTPAENLVGFEDAVRSLSHKIDTIAQGAIQGTGDPLAFKQLEQAVVQLRGIVSHVASDDTLAQLAAEVRNLSLQFERAATESNSEALTRLEARVASLMERGHVVPPELEVSIRQLSERLDRMQLSQGDRLALEALEDRIAKLSQKLDSSDQRLGQLDAIGRGLADLLVHLQEMKNAGRAMRAAPPAEPSQEPAPQPAPVAAPAPARAQTPVHVQAPVHAKAPAHAQASPLDLIPDMPEEIAPEMVQTEAPQPAPMPAPPPAPKSAAPMAALPMAAAPQPLPAKRAPQMPRGPQLQPIDPNLPPDTPLEPGSGIPRMRPGSAAARIAASEAALSGFRAAAADPASRAAALLAARNAAKSASLDTPLPPSKVREPKKSRGFKWPFSKKAKASVEPQLPPAPAQPVVQPPVQTATPAAPAKPAAAATPAAATAPVSLMPGAELPNADVAELLAPRGWRLGLLVKKLLIAGSVAAIIVGGALMVFNMISSPELPPLPSTDLPDTLEVPANPPASTPSQPAPRGLPNQGSLTPSANPDVTGQIGNGSSPFFDPSTMMMQRPQGGDVTGSIVPKTTPSRSHIAAPAPVATAATAPAGPTGNSAVDALPSSISTIMRQALVANEPGAEYELGIRYLDGRGVPQNAAEAVRWLQRASDAGFAPAQFRLAGLNEKGDGVRKDVQAARRLYLAAAGKGHAKAMHNLAVLYAEGIDGKPDYKAASEWFRKAANYGLADSQYNLAILFARGIGVQSNLAESYRWFSLAAAAGDTEAAKKRDEVATRLDAQSLSTAKAAARDFIAEREPDEATNLRAPPGGWDKVPALPAKPKRPAP
ncbi:tetratricopeptide repeat protein [Rhodoplanes sp. Z2-YC6860]|uniref:tetratricopeptide repeat protein n=1 Tax=Rhodoplanes sp. Z2-YC6860 TaxID=674703 RepID=UPI0012EDC45E|nr:tetratricopeptide repeat protein [Rhodoplanes sp. Z2-YC6860]